MLQWNQNKIEKEKKKISISDIQESDLSILGDWLQESSLVTSLSVLFFLFYYNNYP